MLSLSLPRFGFWVLGSLCLLVFVRSSQQHWQLRRTGAAPAAHGALRVDLAAAPGLHTSRSFGAQASVHAHAGRGADRLPAVAPSQLASRLDTTSGLDAEGGLASEVVQPPLPAASPASSRAVVSLMMAAQGKNESKYTDCLVFMIDTLRAAGWRHDILVMATHDARAADVARVRALGVAITRVSNIAALSSSDPSMLNMFTKLHAWNLTQYAQVAFYDSDHVFLRDPTPAFEDCGEAPFCATGDSGIADFYRRPDAVNEHTYFNAGFMVLRPNATTQEWLMAQRHLGEGTPFVDQDMLNSVYAGTWTRLNERYNRMHTYRRGITDDTVAIHEKVWVLQKHFPEPHWRWNAAPLPP
jgi:hypothetical protein